LRNYFDDIFIYSINRTKHQQLVRQIFERLRQNKLYIKLSKCEFSIILIIFLGFVISTRSIEINKSKIKVIAEWPKSKSFRNIQVFLNFANFYRRFIRDYSRIAAPLTSIFKQNINGRKINPFKFKEVVRTAFKLLKIFFTRAPILIHFNPNRSIKIEINILKFAITGILS
jgi:hypothetical protein